MSTTNLEITIPGHRRVLVWSQVKHYFAEWRRRASSRHELLHLDLVELQDLGMSRCDAVFEASKPFWQP
jgi:uncharacterized protein YjiS (DUF1127 family)